MAQKRTARPVNALVAASSRVDLSARSSRHTAKATWQDEAWGYFDSVPEIKESIRYRANQMGRLRLFVAVANPEPGGEPIPVLDPESGVPASVAATATAELGRLHSRFGGAGEILRQLDMNLEVAGEAWLVGRGERIIEAKGTDGSIIQTIQPEEWRIHSVSEVTHQGSKWSIKSSPNDTKGTPIDEELDSIDRIWLPHPEFYDLADSPLKALRADCQALQVLSAQVLAEANSRQSAGAFTIPNELSFGPVSASWSEDGGEADEDPFMDALTAALTDPITDPTSAASVMPMLIRGPAEFLKPDVLRRIDFARDAGAGIEERISARISRIARGLNLPVEKVMGLAGTTFANATQVDEDEFNDYLQPSAEIDVHGLTAAFLVHQMAANPAIGPEWAAVMFVWYDPSALMSSPDLAAGSDKALDALAISTETYRRVNGYSEADAPDPIEMLARSVLKRGQLSERITAAALAQGGIGEPIVIPEGPDAASAAGSVTAAARRPRSRDYGRELHVIDTDLRARLIGAADSAMSSALTRAGNRLRSKANGTEAAGALRGIAPQRGFAQLGETLVAAILGETDPLAGAWDLLEERFMAWGAGAQAQAIDIASVVASGFSAAEREVLKLRQAENLAEAWAWMRDALDVEAMATLFGPDLIPVAGESLGTTVPMSLIRQAMARAGGATGLTSGQGAWVAMSNLGTTPLGGIAGGELLMGAMLDAGASVEGYQWVYGPASRKTSFEPHVALDGVEFVNFDDAVLTNTAGWPETAYFIPGDHAGCSCDVVARLVPAGAGA